MPSNLSFLSGSRSARDPSYPIYLGSSRCRAMQSTALAQPYTNYEAWMPPNAFTPPIPWQTTNTGFVKRISAVSPQNDPSTYDFAVLAGNNDTYTNQYTGDLNYMIAHNFVGFFGYDQAADVVWEFSIWARIIQSNTWTETETGISSYTWAPFADTNPPNSPLSVELFLFGCDGQGNYDFDGNQHSQIDGDFNPWSGDTGFRLDSPRTGATFYSRRQDVHAGVWNRLRMYVKFSNESILYLSARVDNNNNGKLIAFANPRLIPHHISFGKTLGYFSATNQSVGTALQ